MNTKLIFIVLLLVCGFNLRAQTSISGIITDSLKNPVPFASVYLSNTTMGTSANDHGAYKLDITQNGAYELIVTCIGYKSYSKTIHVEEKDLVFNITLYPDYKILNEVVVTAKDNYRKRNYSMFIKIFFGETVNASKCKILNPEDLFLIFDRKERVLSGRSVKPLVIENKALGYNIIYNLINFKYYENDMLFNYSGNHYFQSHEGSPQEKEEWKINRLKTYYGSRMHFLRALYSDKLYREGFGIYEYKEEQSTYTYSNDEILAIKTLRFNQNIDNIEVYYPKKIVIYYESTKPGVNLANYQYEEYSSKATFARPVKIYANGFFEDGYSITWEGRMSNDRMANMLPFDFVPGK